MKPLITIAIGALATLAPGWQRDTSGAPILEVATDSLEKAKALHALNRLAFGPRPGDVGRVAEIGVTRWIDQQLNPETIEDVDLHARLETNAVLSLTSADFRAMFERDQRERRRRQQAQNRDSAVAQNRDMAQPAMQPYRSDLRRATAQFQQLALTRAILSQRQLQEVLVDFWTNHFNVFLGKGPLRYLTPSYIEHVIRPNALGRFEDLLVATAQSPAMMFYLDNAQSVAPGSEPPELAQAERRVARLRRARPQSQRADRIQQMEQRLQQQRERIPDGINENYARELLELHTLGVDGGYTQDDVIEVARILTGWSIDRPGRRGTAFAFHDWAHDGGEKTVLGREFAPGRGMDEGLELLHLLAGHPATMRHVGSKLCARLVNDDPPAGCVQAAVEAWQASDGDIREVVRAIVSSPDFWAVENRATKTKSPLEFIVSSVRAVGGEPDSTPALGGMVARLGQPLYLHQPPDGYPESQESWVNAGALLNRLNMALRLAGPRAPGMKHDAERIAPLADDVDAMIAAVNASILAGAGSPNTLRVMREQVDGVRDPQRVRTMLIAYALGSPEFQRQ